MMSLEFKYDSAIPRRDAPEFLQDHSPRKTEGAGNAGCPLHPQPRVRNKTKHTSVVTTGSDGSTGIPLAMVLRLIPRSPRRRIRLVTVICGLKVCRSPVGPTRLRKFNTSNGCQNHTASPSAESIVRLRTIRQLTSLVDPPCHPLTSPDAAASTASRPALVTTRDRPSVGQDGATQ